jgi:hypothetical protein
LEGDRQFAGELARLAALQQHLRALEDPQADLSEIDSSLSPGVQRRLTARLLNEAIRAERVARADRDLEFLQRRARHLARLALSHPVRVHRPVPAPPPPVAPPPPTTVSPPPVRRAPRRRRTTRVVQPSLPLRGMDLPEFWSPTPVLGFRVWAVRAKLCGVQRAWETPCYTAGCLDFGEVDDPEVPHTDGRCRPPPCGLYAAKSSGVLVGEFGLPPAGRRWAYGMVALTGKVVEHERGYRARHARAVAVAVVEGRRLIRVDGPSGIEELFADPERLLELLPGRDPDRVEVVSDGGLVKERLVAYLDEVRLVAEGAGVATTGEG